jgi:uncharacterized membrane protein YidH (DUF202 family)
VFDPGLQPERTALAWRRTLLAVAVGALVSLRILPPVLGSWSIGLSLGGVVAGGVLWAAARRRAEAVDAALLHRRRTLPGGRLPAVLGGVVAVGALTGLVCVLLLSPV